MRTEKTLQALRPFIASALAAESIHENFQNQVLRPVLKYQHDLFIQVIEAQKNYQRGVAGIENSQDRLRYTQQFIQQNKAIRQLLLGCVIGLFTKEELSFYFEHQKALNKRIIDMIAVRIGG